MSVEDGVKDLEDGDLLLLKMVLLMFLKMMILMLLVYLASPSLPWWVWRTATASSIFVFSSSADSSIISSSALSISCKATSKC